MKKLLLIQLQLIFLQLCTLQKKFFFFSKYFMKMTPLITKNGKIIIVGSSEKIAAYTIATNFFATVHFTIKKKFFFFSKYFMMERSCYSVSKIL